MRLPDFRYVEPKSLEEACLFLAEHVTESRVVAGGTDLFPSMKQRILMPKYVINLSSIPDLDSFQLDAAKGLRIGPSVKVRSLEKDPVILEKYPSIARAAAEVASPQLREMGTV